MMYLVKFFEDGVFIDAAMKSDIEIIDWLDMSDCYNYWEIEVYDVSGSGVEPLHVYGTWHNFDDPLYIKVCRENGEIVFDGYGTDH